LHKSPIGSRLWGWAMVVVHFICNCRSDSDGLRRTLSAFQPDPRIRGEKAEPLLQQTTDDRVEPVPQFGEPRRRSCVREQDSARRRAVIAQW